LELLILRIVVRLKQPITRSAKWVAAGHLT
jgi:hypothetical protein